MKSLFEFVNEANKNMPDIKSTLKTGDIVEQAKGTLWMVFDKASWKEMLQSKDLDQQRGCIEKKRVRDIIFVRFEITSRYKSLRYNFEDSYEIYTSESKLYKKDLTYYNSIFPESNIVAIYRGKMPSEMTGEYAKYHLIDQEWMMKEAQKRKREEL